MRRCRATQSAWARGMAFGEDLEPVHHLEKADVILSLEADFLAWGPGRLKDARAFAGRRDVERSATVPSMNRLYVVECTPSITGAAADHRLAISSRDVGKLARALAAAIKTGDSAGPADAAIPAGISAHASWIKALVRDLTANRGKSLVIAGDTQPAEVHALAHLINHSLGNIGKTVEFLPRADAGPADQPARWRAGPAIEAGAVETLIIIEGNPAYDAPADLDFATCWRQKRPSCGFTWVSTTTRPPGCVTGIFLKPIAWKRGVICGRSTAR